MVLPTVLILLLSWAAGLGGETRPRAAAAERRPGRAQRRGAGPRARVRAPRLLSAFSARLSRPRAALPARYCPPRVPTALPPPAARAGCGAPGQAFPAPTAGRPYQPSFSAPLSREPRSPGQPPSHTLAATSALPGSEPWVRADSQQLARLAARRVHCSGSGREGASERGDPEPIRAGCRAPVCLSHSGAFPPRRTRFGVFAASAPECVCLSVSPLPECVRLLCRLGGKALVDLGERQAVLECSSFQPSV